MEKKQYLKNKEKRKRSDIERLDRKRFHFSFDDLSKSLNCFNTNGDFVDITVQWLSTQEDLKECSSDSIEEFMGWSQFNIENADVSIDNKDGMKTLQELKENFSTIPTDCFLKARSYTNLFEKISRQKFINRSAIKLANIDSLVNLLPKALKKETFYFADVCGGPGGFSQYIVWRLNSFGTKVVGRGISLREHCDWKKKIIKDDLQVEFKTSYGEDETGDLYKLENINHFSKEIFELTGSKGVDLVVADGGFPDASDRPDQEQVMQHLILCEILMMFHILSLGGNFVCKFFELQDEFSCSLVYLLYRTFSQISIVKPVTSRPASSERYIICKGLKMYRPQVVLNHLNSLATSFINKKKNDSTGNIDSLLGFFKYDLAFLNYIKNSNNEIMNRQTLACQSIIDFFYSKPSFKVMKKIAFEQKMLIQVCCEKWKL